MITLTYTIADEKLDEFKAGFLKRCPVPKDEEGNPLYSDNAWIKEWGRRQFMSRYKGGKQSLATQTAIIENNIIE